MKALKLVERTPDVDVSTEVQSWNGRLQMASLAPNGVKKLRELILELGVRGMLVPQDVKENVSRTSTEAAPPNSFNLPSKWVWARLSQTGVIFSGNSINEREKLSKYK